MPGTRSSARLAASGSSPSSQDKNSSPRNAGNKRKADTGSSPPKSKRGRKSNAEKQQKTLEETMPDLKDDENKEDDQPKDIEMKEAAAEGEGTDVKPGEAEGKGAASRGPSCWFWADKYAEKPKASNDEKLADQANKGTELRGDIEAKTSDGQERDSKGDEANNEPLAEEKPSKGESTSKMDDTGEVEQKEEEKGSKDSKIEEAGAAHANGAVYTDPKREAAVPSRILEKGIIYFFVRGRVGVDDPAGIKDIARTYIILRPLPNGAELKDGPIQDFKNNRLFALPKKVLPKSHRDAFMTFVEKANVGIDTLKDDFMQGSEYNTKTTGVRHTPPATPVGEGVYAITTTGRASHLVYMLTIPQELGQAQKDLGLAEQGSYIVQVKNPTQKGPANASLPQGPEFPPECVRMTSSFTFYD